MRVVGAELLAEHAADLADGARGRQRVAHRVQEVRVTLRGLPDSGEYPLDRDRVPLGPHPCRPLDLSSLGLRVEPVELDPLRLLLLGEAIDSDDDALLRLDLPLIGERGLLDLALDEPGLDRRDGTPELVDPLDQLESARSLARP